EAYYGGLTLLPTSAVDGFRNDRAKDGKQTTNLPSEFVRYAIDKSAGDGADADGGEQTRVDVTLPGDWNETAHQQRRRIARADKVTSTPFALPDTGAELYRSCILRLFDHTPTELRLLDALLKSEGDVSG